MKYAEVLFRKMIDTSTSTTTSSRDSSVSIAPDVVSYNLMLRTIARGRHHPDAVERAEYWMGELVLSPTLTPEVGTYKTLFRILADSQLQNKSRRARYWLDQCDDDAFEKDGEIRALLREMKASDSIKVQKV